MSINDEEKSKRREEKKKRVNTAVNGVVSGLTAMQREFLIFYLLDGNATEAARQAGYAHPNTAGPRLLREDNIKAAIETYFYAREMPARKAVALMSEKASFDPTIYMHFIKEEDGRVTDVWIDLEEIRADGLGHLVKGTKYSRDGRLMIEFEGALKPLEDIMRYHGLFKDNLNLDIDVSGLSDEELDKLDSTLS